MAFLLHRIQIGIIHQLKSAPQNIALRESLRACVERVCIYLAREDANFPIGRRCHFLIYKQ